MDKPKQRIVTYQLGDETRDQLIWAKGSVSEAVKQIIEHVWLTCSLDEAQTKDITIRCSSIIAVRDAF